MTDRADPHADQPVLTAGPPPDQASAVVLLLHGRGATATDILSIHAALGLPELAALAPQAPGRSWYPHSFLAPLDSNQPYLDSALRRIESLVTGLHVRGVPSERIAILGFSQGACITLEFAARHPARYGAIIGLTGGLIGPPGTPRDYLGSFDDTPVFLGSSDPDPHIPFERVQETQEVLVRMGATVDLRRYPDMGHMVNADELDACRTLLARVLTGQPE